MVGRENAIIFKVYCMSIDEDLHTASLYKTIDKKIIPRPHKNI